MMTCHICFTCTAGCREEEGPFRHQFYDLEHRGKVWRNGGLGGVDAVLRIPPNQAMVQNIWP